MTYYNYKNYFGRGVFMSTYYKSQREFAKLAKISSQRLKMLIETGKIAVHEGGMIHVSQLNYFIRERFLNCISSRGGGTLYVGIDMTDEEMSSYKEEVRDGTMVIASVDELLANLSKDSIDKAMGMSSQNLIELRYKKLVLKEFVKRFKAALQRHLMKYCDDVEIAQIPLGIIYELMLYSKVYSYEIEDIALAERMCRKPMADMKQSFDIIVDNLNLYDSSTGEPLFIQEEITPEFVTAIEALKDDESTPSNAVLSDIFAKIFCLGEGKSGRGKDSQKIVESIANKLSNSAKSTMISDIVTHGFCSFVNIKADISTEECCKISSDLTAGFYSEVKFLCSKEYANQNLPEALAVMFNSLMVAHRLRISYI